MIEFSIAELVKRFPIFRVAFGVVTAVGLAREGAAALEAYVAAAEGEARRLLGASETADACAGAGTGR
jgi:hypothetical protein